MERQNLEEFENASVRINYNTKTGVGANKAWAEQSRTGILKAVGLKVVVFWPMGYDDEVDTEVLIFIKDINFVTPLN